MMTSPITAFIDIVTAGVCNGMNLAMQVGRFSVKVPSCPRPFLAVTLRPHQADHAGEGHRRFIDLNHQNERYGSTAPEGVAGFSR